MKLSKDNGVKNSFGETNTRYVVLIKKQSGFYDPDNGAKKIYYDDGTLKQTYHLVNGDFNGLREFYYPNGKLDISVQYKNDVEHGNYTRYFYEDEGEGKLLFKETGNYYNEEKDGLWKFTYLGNNEHRTLEFHTYSNGIKNGPFYEAQGDSLISGNYKMNKLDGQYKVYLDLKRKYEGGVIITDITQLELLAKGSYADGKRMGSWWESNLSYVSEGDYFNDKKTNEWKYTFLKHENDAGKELPYSNQLFLTENFKDGQLNGLSTRYWSVKTEEYPCSEEEKQVNESDTCYRTTSQEMLMASHYKQDQLDGLYELKDKQGNIVTKGYYLNGIKDGGWVEREFTYDSTDYRIESKGFYTRGIKEGDWTEKETISFDSGESWIITSKGKYENDIKHGEWKRYNDNGFHTETVNYKNNKLDGKSTSWYDVGSAAEIKVFDKGKLTEFSKYKPESLGEPYMKYQIIPEISSQKSYKKTVYFKDGYFSQEYSVIDSGVSDYEDINGTFLSPYLTDPLGNNEGYKNGVYQEYDNDEKLVKYGEYYKEDRIGTWITYFNNQDIQIEVEYNSNRPSLEKYIEIKSGKPVSGAFIYTDQEENTKEIRNIKNGFRNGNTKIYNLETDKFIKKEKHKDGVLK